MPGPGTMSDFERGDAIRREVLGDAYVNRAGPGATELAQMWRRFATEASWGKIWARPGLELKTRSLCTIAALVALGDARELRTHLRGALNLGVEPSQLAEVFIQVAGYAGMSKAGSAFEIMNEVQSALQDEAEA